MLTQSELIDYVEFPDPLVDTDEEGIIAIGGELSPEFLISAYRQGIFPWFNEGEDPIMWWSPNPRCVFELEEIHISKNLKRLFKQKKYRFRSDTCFEEVMKNCRHANRKGEVGTWISDDIYENYVLLHHLGIAHSFEVFNAENQLVGGLYGLSLGNIFYGESMFATESNTSKLAFYFMSLYLKEKKFELIDCQVTNDHLMSLGCKEIARDSFLEKNKKSCLLPTNIGLWTNELEIFGKNFVNTYF